MGVWIEIARRERAAESVVVTPCMGVWIEIVGIISVIPHLIVTPCMGVWIEIKGESITTDVLCSHSLYGSVD